MSDQFPKVTDAPETFPYPTYAFRMNMIKRGLEGEMRGFRLTRKAPSCFAILRNEFGIKGRDKQAVYEEFCNRFGFEPKKEP